MCSAVQCTCCCCCCCCRAPRIAVSRSGERQTWKATENKITHLPWPVQPLHQLSFSSLFFFLPLFCPTPSLFAFTRQAFGNKRKRLFLVCNHNGRRRPPHALAPPSPPPTPTTTMVQTPSTRRIVRAPRRSIASRQTQRDVRRSLHSQPGTT